MQIRHRLNGRVFPAPPGTRGVFTFDLTGSHDNELHVAHLRDVWDGCAGFTPSVWMEYLPLIGMSYTPGTHGTVGRFDPPLIPSTVCVAGLGESVSG